MQYKQKENIFISATSAISINIPINLIYYLKFDFY